VACDEDRACLAEASACALRASARQAPLPAR